MTCAVHKPGTAQGHITPFWLLRQKNKKVFKNILTFDTTFVRILNCDDELHSTSLGMLPWLSW